MSTSKQKTITVRIGTNKPPIAKVHIQDNTLHVTYKGKTYTYADYVKTDANGNVMPDDYPAAIIQAVNDVINNRATDSI